MATTELATRRAAFRKLHESGCFVIPNPWDVGTARYLCHLGFTALATTSAGFAFSIGLPDADVPLDAMLKHIAEIVASMELPVNADFESGYAHQPEGVAANVRRCVETGVAGLSIEDSTGDRAKPLYDLPAAVERMKASPRGNRRYRRGCPTHGTSGMFSGWAPGAIERSHPAAAGVCGSGRGRPLRAGSSGAFGYSGDRFGGESEAGKCSDERKYRAQGSGSGGAGRATNQRGEFAGAGGLGRVHTGGEGDRGGRKFRGL